VYQFHAVLGASARVYDRSIPGTSITAPSALPRIAGVPSRSATTLICRLHRRRSSAASGCNGGQSKTQAGVTDNQLFLQYILTLGAHRRAQSLKKTVMTHQTLATRRRVSRLGRTGARQHQRSSATAAGMGCARSKSWARTKVKVYTATSRARTSHHVERSRVSSPAPARRSGRRDRRRARDRLAAAVTPTSGKSQGAGGQTRLLRGGAAGPDGRKADGVSIAPRATFTRWAIRTFRPIHATSHASPGRFPQDGRADPANAAYYQASYKGLRRALDRGDRAWERRPYRSGRRGAGSAQGLSPSARLAGHEKRLPRWNRSPASSRPSPSLRGTGDSPTPTVKMVIGRLTQSDRASRGSPSARRSM